MDSYRTWNEDGKSINGYLIHGTTLFEIHDMALHVYEVGVRTLLIQETETVVYKEKFYINFERITQFPCTAFCFSVYWYESDGSVRGMAGIGADTGRPDKYNYLDPEVAIYAHKLLKTMLPKDFAS